MNRFDREYWDGAREMALMFYESVKSRSDVPDDLKRLAETALRETGERKNRDFREALGVTPDDGRSQDSGSTLDMGAKQSRFRSSTQTR
jgi:hypothetical protein